MAFVRDRWTTRVDGKQVRTTRWGKGKRWQAEWDEPGGQHRTLTFTVKDAAEAHLADTVSKINRGAYVSSAAGEITLRDYAEGWRAQQIHQRRRSKGTISARWHTMIDPTLGAMKLNAITRAHVQAAVVTWTQSQSPHSVRSAYGTLRSALQTAHADKRISENPCKRINLPPIVRAKIVPLTGQMVRHLAGAADPRYEALVLMAAATGMRSSELTGVTVDSGHLKFNAAGVIIVVDRQLDTTEPTWGPPKSENSNREIQCDQIMAKALRGHMMKYPPHPSGLLFTTSRGRPVAKTTMGDIWKHATAGLVMRKRSGWHDLRHFHASLLIHQGLSVAAVADRLGDSQKVILDTYIHLWPNDESLILTAIQTGLWDVVKPASGLRLMSSTSGT